MSHTRLIACLSVLLLAVLPRAAAPTAPQRETVPLSGERFQAALVQIDASGQATFDASGQRRTIPLNELVSWGALTDATAAAQVFLADGGLLVADVLTSDKEAMKVDSAIFGEQSIPLELLAAVMLRPPADAQRRDRFADKLLSAARGSDHVVLENGDELLGVILSLGEGAEGAVALDAEVGKVTLRRDKIAGMAFDPALVAPASAKGPRILVGFDDGTRLIAASLRVHGDDAELSLPSGLEWKAARKSLVSLQPLSGKAAYLSDLKAESYRHLPFLTTSWPYRADRNVAGTQLRAGGRLFAKGIGMHSASRLTYRLDGLYRRFEADVALDDHVGRGAGSVVMRVFVDGQERYKSDVIRGGAPPAPVSVEVSGGKQLSLIVDYAERGDELDRADWLNARLVQ